MGGTACGKARVGPSALQPEPVKRGERPREVQATSCESHSCGEDFVFCSVCCGKPLREQSPDVLAS